MAPYALIDSTNAELITSGRDFALCLGDAPYRGLRVVVRAPGESMFVVEVNGKPLLSTQTLERAKLLAQSYLRDGNVVWIRPQSAPGEQVGYVYDSLAIAWITVGVH
jgi:hypothetical protein